MTNKITARNHVVYIKIEHLLNADMLTMHYRDFHELL